MHSGLSCFFVVQVNNCQSRCRRKKKGSLFDLYDIRILEGNLQKNVKMYMGFCSICCFLSKIHLRQSFFLKKIWCVRKQLVILHRLKKVKAFDNGKRLYSNNG